MRNLKGELLCLKTENIKPNFSELSRIYGIDRRTVKKQYLGITNEKEKKKKTSVLDKYKELIIEKLKIPGSNKKAVYMYLIMNVDDKIGSYSNFRKYTLKHFNDLKTKNDEVHVRYETFYGKQLQFDWKGPIKLINKNNEMYEFYIFSTTLSASRFHTFIYSKFMTLESVERCLIESFEMINGVPEECLTDNMSSIINLSEKEFVKEFKAFSKDMNYIPKKCKLRSPETKNKDESWNIFIKFLNTYNNEFETEEDLINIIKKLNEKINLEVNQTTNMAPTSLFRIEKEYLKPLPNKQVINSYLDTMIPAKVPNTLLVYYKGSQYSVPKKYINQTVKLKEIDNKLLIYYNKNLIVTHDISNKKFNYKEEHYKEGLYTSIKYKTDNEINELAKKNLELLDKFTK